MTGVRHVTSTSGAIEEDEALGFGGLLRAEWTKLRSVRSTVWSLLLLVILTLGFSALFTWLTVSQWSKSSVSEQQQIVADPVGTILGGDIVNSCG